VTVVLFGCCIPPISGGRVQAPLRTGLFNFPDSDPSTEAAVAAHLKSTREQIRAAQKQQQQMQLSRR
jgi:hypothetical protein